MSIVAVDFGHDPDDLLTVRWQPRNTPIAQRWLAALSIASPLGINEADRFYNFPEDGWSYATIADDLNACIETIIAEHGDIFHGLRASPSMSQDAFNVLHTYFEMLRGSIEAPADHYVLSSAAGKKAIERYNVLIHRWEDHGHTSRFVVTFKEKQRASLEDADYEHFTFAHDFGAMRLNYCQVGKPLYDVWKDGDDDVGHEAIRPLACYSADFNVSFGNGMTEQEHQQRMAEIWEWFDRKSNLLMSLGFQKHDPRLALGHIVLADLINDVPRTTLIDMLATRRRVANVRIE